MANLQVMFSQCLFLSAFSHISIKSLNHIMGSHVALTVCPHLEPDTINVTSSISSLTSVFRSDLHSLDSCHALLRLGPDPAAGVPSSFSPYHPHN